MFWKIYVNKPYTYVRAITISFQIVIFSVRSAGSSVQSKVCSAQSAGTSVHSKVCSAQSAGTSVHSKVCSALSAGSSVHSKVCSAQASSRFKSSMVRKPPEMNLLPLLVRLIINYLNTGTVIPNSQLPCNCSRPTQLWTIDWLLPQPHAG